MKHLATQFDPKEIDAAGRVLVDVPQEGEDDSERSANGRLGSLSG